jgi:hypothetical protein
MNDDLAPDHGRDERVASLLAVPHLDELTRRRLVSRALAGAGARRGVGSRRVLLPAAAALVVLALVGVGAFVLTNRDGDTGSTAARSRSATPEARPSATRASATVNPSTAGVRDLGELGDLGDSTDLRRRVGDALRHPAPAVRATAAACLDRAVTGSPAPTAFATGIQRGRPVLVLVLPASGDRTTAVLLDMETCRAATVVNLP